jgi:RNA polymerase-binding transcription factor DksA
VTTVADKVAGLAKLFLLLQDHNMPGLPAWARLHREAEVPTAGVVGGDFLDVAQGVEQQELARLNASRLIEQARRLRLALTRLSNGEYGACSECGASIAAKRLLAIPDAVTCVACQDRLERVGAAVRARANDGDDLDTM